MSGRTWVERAAIVAFFAAIGSGCAWGPGMRMNESALRDRTEGTDAGFVLIPLTPDAVREQTEAAQRRPQTPPDPLDALARNYEYRIAPQDVLSVIVWEHPELTIPAGEFRPAEAAGHVVSSDGTIYFPHVGVVPVAGKTLPEIRSMLTSKLDASLTKPQLDVRVAAFRGKWVQVTGEVKKPTRLPITDVPMHALDAINFADGATVDADLRRVVLTRDGKPYLLDLQSVDERGDVSANWLLQEGDVLHVPDRSLNKVFVLGEVHKPGSRLMTRGRMNLAEALGDSEGLNLDTSDASGIYVIRGSYQTPRVFQLDARSPDALLLATQFPLQPLDVVFVSTLPLSQWNRIVTQILPTISAITMPLYLARGIVVVP